MEDETITKDDSLVEDQEVTDDDLSAAFDSFVRGDEDVQVEEPIEEEVVEETEELSQGEKTGLGRKVAKLHERLDNLSSGVATKSDLLDILKRLDDLKSITKEEPEHDSYEEEDFHIESKADLDRYFEKRELERKNQELASRKQYQDKYIDTMKELLSDIDDKVVASKVYNELVKQGGEFNKVLSDDPVKDCSKNLFKALKFVEKESNRSPFTRDVKDVKTGVSGGTTTTTTKKVVPKLDEVAAEFAKRMNMSEDEIIESFSRETPMGLRR